MTMPLLPLGGVPFYVRALPAAALTLVMTFMSMKGFELSSLLSLNILFVLHPLYYFCMVRPRLFPLWAAFLLGFAVDLVVGRLLGLNAFMLVFACMVILRQRRYLLSQPFATQWVGFLFLCMGAELIRWVAMMGVSMSVLSPASALVSGVCNAALYPLSALVMLGVLRVVSLDDKNTSL